MSQSVCLITGVGAGTGTALVRRFAQSNYQIAMLARNRDRLKKLEKELPSTKAYVCDVGDLQALLATIEAVRSQMGNPSVLIHNAVGATFGNFLEADPEDLERNFRVNTTSLLYLARELAPAMIAAERGAIIVTGNTAAWRGIPSYALFSPTKAAQRILAQSLARDLGAKGVHVAYITIDAAIATPWSMDKLVRGLKTAPLTKNRDLSSDFFCQPVDIAEEVFHVVHQAKSAWSFEVEIRPFGEKW
ncbi:MAG: SDR family NAD(P)-dependent oxidoreductase [Cyanobacteria bacterium P01_A01_bin.40]